jgi:acetate kinase
MNILVLNAGSSTQKMSLYKLADDFSNTTSEPAWQVKMTINWSASDPLKWQELIEKQLSLLTQGPDKVLTKIEDIDVVGHRVVHGGTKYLAATVINDDVKADIKSLTDLAPLHNQINLAGICAVEKLLGAKTSQVAVFDTAFHRSIPLATSLYAVPYEWFEQDKIHKFGFHGINHEYCAKRAAQMLSANPADLSMIVCHLGSGCSLAAVESGKSVDTTMGFTPLDGLMMSSRCGTIDPGVLIHLLKKGKLSIDDLDDALNKRSGLLGVSRLTSDMALIIEAMQKGDENAKLAFDMYTLRIRQLICVMRASLKGLDALVFTAGVGENAAAVRQSVVENLAFLGVQFDPQLNSQTKTDGIISTPGAKTKVLVISAREDWAIANECRRLVEQPH